MKKNIGSIDKILRLVIGLALLAYGFVSGSLLGLIGIVPIFTALINICPLYSILGLSTSCSISNKDNN